MEELLSRLEQLVGQASDMIMQAKTLTNYEDNETFANIKNQLTNLTQNNYNLAIEMQTALLDLESVMRKMKGSGGSGGNGEFFGGSDGNTDSPVKTPLARRKSVIVNNRRSSMMSP